MSRQIRRAQERKLARKLTRQDRHVPSESKRRKNLAIQIFYGDRPIVMIGVGTYIVPSGTTGDVSYIVNLIYNTCECKCWRHEHRACKHIYAARMYREQIEGGTAPDHEPAQEPSEYKHPPHYEKLRRVRRPCVRQLLRCVGRQVETLASKISNRKIRRPKTKRGDLVIGAALQAIEDDPSRDALSDYDGLERSGLFAGPTPRAYTLRRGLIDSDVLDGVRWAFSEMAKFAFQIERWFVIDSTYFKTPYYTGRIQVKNQHGKMVSVKVKNAKIFIVCGLLTGLPVACFVTDFNFSDQTAFPIIFRQMMERGAIVSGGGFIGDAGFNAGLNFELVHAHGGRAYFDFDVNSVPSKKGEYPHRDEMLRMHDEDLDAWLAIYHQRELIEWTNHAIKTVFKRTLRARMESTRELEATSLLLVYGLSLLPGLRLERNMTLPFADDEALAFIDRALAPKRKRIILPTPSEEMYYPGNVIQFPSVGVPLHVQRLG